MATSKQNFAAAHKIARSHGFKGAKKDTTHGPVARMTHPSGSKLFVSGTHWNHRSGDEQHSFSHGSIPNTLSKHLSKHFGQDTKITGKTAAAPPSGKKGKEGLHPLHTYKC